MKYFSDVTKEVYDTEDALHEAEKKVAEAERVREEKLASIRTEKKALSKEVDDAEQELTAAYGKLEVAKEDAKKLLEEFQERIDNILTPAEDAVKEAQRKKYEAIKKFNEKFGVYTTVYDEPKAAEELGRVIRTFNNIFGGLFF